MATNRRSIPSNRIRVWRDENPIGDLVVDNGKVIADPPNKSLLDFLDECYVGDPANSGARLSRDDGVRYLEALPYNFAGTYLHMSPA